MFFQRSMIAVAAGVGLLQAGCSMNAEMDADVLGIDGPEYHTLDSNNGTQTGNGLSGDAATESMSDLLQAMTSRVYSPSNLGVTDLLDDPKGHATLKYAFGCALPTSEELVAGDIVGEGILKTTYGWRNNRLSIAQQENVLTCLVTRLNPYGANVPIRLTGAIVNDTTGQGFQSYTYPEALWVATISSGTVTFHAWPLSGVINHCEDGATTGVETRVCGSRESASGMAPGCNVNVRDDIETVCTYAASTDSYTCLGRPAIKSWLQPIDAYTLYPNCTPDPG